MPKQITRHHELHWLISQYREASGKSDVDTHELALYAQQIGWKLPEPKNPIDLLAQDLARLMREETKTDRITGKPYRVNHNYSYGQATLWFDIDDLSATRPKMQASLISRRNQMIDDGLQLTFDADHWNSGHPAEAPIQIPMNFTDDINERKAAES